jgi:hypothetical protein
MTLPGRHEPPAGWCFHCEQSHGPMDWRDGCQDADDVRFAEQHDRFRQAWQQVEAWRAGRLKRWTVCWWKHRTRRYAPGVYLSRSCWACADPQQEAGT